MVEPVKLLPCKLCGKTPVASSKHYVCSGLRDTKTTTEIVHPFIALEHAAWHIVMSPSPREAVLEEALRDIARQELRGEMSRSDQAYADWEVGFELCVGRARTALSAPAVSPVSEPETEGRG